MLDADDLLARVSTDVELTGVQEFLMEAPVLISQLTDVVETQERELRRLDDQLEATSRAVKGRRLSLRRGAPNEEHRVSLDRLFERRERLRSSRPDLEKLVRQYRILSGELDPREVIEEAVGRKGRNLYYYDTFLRRRLSYMSDRDRDSSMRMLFDGLIPSHLEPDMLDQLEGAVNAIGLEKANSSWQVQEVEGRIRSLVHRVQGSLFSVEANAEHVARLLRDAERLEQDALARGRDEDDAGSGSPGALVAFEKALVSLMDGVSDGLISGGSAQVLERMEEDMKAVKRDLLDAPADVSREDLARVVGQVQELMGDVRRAARVMVAAHAQSSALHALMESTLEPGGSTELYMRAGELQSAFEGLSLAAKQEYQEHTSTIDALISGLLDEDREREPREY